MKKMKNNYPVPSERYGYTHYFAQIDGDKYVFVPEKEWMPIYVTYNDDGSVYFIDTEGGPCVGVGFKTDEVEVIKIDRTERGEIFTLKEFNNGKTEV